ncbi:MAG: TadE/TadG family type IV pilus assembly protein [Alphaproteobacteria bacterium]|nr:TadE/TadG family type IV pilus assembly protein [Alphaproteobacteria bacterium]
MRERGRVFFAANKGAVGIETALVVPMVVLTLITIIDAHRFVSIGSQVDQAAHLAANAVAREEAVTRDGVEDLLEMAEIISNGRNANSAEGVYRAVLSVLSSASTEDNLGGDPQVVWQVTRGTEIETACPPFVGAAGGRASLPADVSFDAEESIVTVQICYTPVAALFAGRTITETLVGDPVKVQAYYASRRGFVTCLDC